MKIYSIYISGVGGQGIIKTSVVIGEAAMNAGHEVVMSEIHGMAQRGGGVSTELKIGPAHSSIIAEGTADLLISFEPLEALRALPKINKNTYVIMNTAKILPFNIQGSDYPYPPLDDIVGEMKAKSKDVKVLDAVEIANQAGNVLSMNMVMLGVTLTVPGFPLDKERLIESMKANLPEKTIPINMNAFEEGFSKF
ncbi:MAG TPA: indolepyruvate oxidoreductase subunit beta [Methanobacteriaceae archaeon]|nr:indolepyruvate oxidoreductase subunit beta [Methanobacteriaceae archaeon]